MASTVQPNWPPKSPRDALLSSPDGRKKYRDMQRRRENIGSPLKHSEAARSLQSKTDQLLSDGVDGLDDDDEETLQLKLAAIEAKLKLKQIQKRRGRPDTSSSNLENGSDAHSRPTSASSRSQSESQAVLQRPRTATNSATHLDDIQVPLSPTRREVAPAEPWSPRRYIFGIDKGLRGSDVSLKRRPIAKGCARPTSRLGNRESAAFHTNDPFVSQAYLSPAGRPKSFSERIAESRSNQKSRREREERIWNNRSSAFQFDQAEIEAYKTAAAELSAKPLLRSPTKSRQAESFSREDILQSYTNSSASGLKRSQTAPCVRSDGGSASPKGPSNHFHRRSNKAESETPRPINSQEVRDEDNTDKEADSSKFETYSALHLSSRILPRSFLKRTLDEKMIFRIPDLLKTVRAPDFDLPDVEGDYVVLGIVASKSEPREKETSKYISKKETDPGDVGLNNTSKYMVITLTDLKWSIDLFLFDTAFPRYYKLTAGALIAILNPTIMPPPRNKIDTNRFSLAISSSDDKVLEIGFARDIGFCKAARKDGKICQSWIDARKTEFCDFHIDLQVRRAQSQRMGVNNGPGMVGPTRRIGTRAGTTGGDNRGRTGFQKDGLRPEGAQYDRGSQSVYYVAPALKSDSSGWSSAPHVVTGKSAASLIDADEDPFLAASIVDRGLQSKEQRMRKRLADHQRERDIAKKLAASHSGGVGAEYLRAGAGNHVSPSSQFQSKAYENTMLLRPGSETKLQDISTMRKAESIRLSPMKRTHDGNKSHHYGCGVKKTRFITARGIKEAGRDSLGGPAELANNKNGGSVDDDGDDELDII